MTRRLTSSMLMRPVLSHLSQHSFLYLRRSSITPTSNQSHALTSFWKVLGSLLAGGLWKAEVNTIHLTLRHVSTISLHPVIPTNTPSPPLIFTWLSLLWEQIVETWKGVGNNCPCCESYDTVRTPTLELAHSVFPQAVSGLCSRADWFSMESPSLITSLCDKDVCLLFHSMDSRSVAQLIFFTPTFMSSYRWLEVVAGVFLAAEAQFVNLRDFLHIGQKSSQNRPVPVQHRRLYLSTKAICRLWMSRRFTTSLTGTTARLIPLDEIRL